MDVSVPGCRQDGQHARFLFVFNPQCQGALLHKSVCERASPFPGRTYPTGFVTGMPRAVYRLSTAIRTWSSATCRPKSRAMRPWPRSLTQFTLFLRDFGGDSRSAFATKLAQDTCTALQLRFARWHPPWLASKVGHSCAEGVRKPRKGSGEPFP